jgi:hypothetical protein
MKRWAVLIVVVCRLGGATVSAQQPLQVAGYGGIGFASTQYQSPGVPNQQWNQLTTELGLAAGGYIYNPALVNYDLNVAWDGNNTSVEQGTARSNGLQYNGNFSFLPDRPYPFSVYFQRDRIYDGGSLLPALSTLNTLWGARGQIKEPRLAMIFYDFGLGKTQNTLPGQAFFDTNQRFANVGATRKLEGWDLRMGDNYLRISSTYSGFFTGINTLSADASRRFGDRIYVNLNAMDVDFHSRFQGSASPSRSNVIILSGNMTWKHTPKLDSYYNFNVARNAENTLQLLLAANGQSVPPATAGPTSLNTISESSAAGLNYRPLSGLSLTGGVMFSQTGIAQQALEGLTSSEQNAFVKQVLGATASASYHHKFWKLDDVNTDSVTLQRYALEGGGKDSTVGYNLENSLRGGDIRKLRFNASFRYLSQTNPIFFDVLTEVDRRATLRLDTDYFRAVRLEGSADLGSTDMNLLGSNIKLDTSSYSASASLKRLTLYASRGLSNSADLLLGENSILNQPGGSTGGVEIPSSLLNPTVFSTVLSKRVGLNLRLRENLHIESRFTDYSYLFTYQGATSNLFKEFDTIVYYKFGRFTVIAGYGNGNSLAPSFNQHAVQYYVRIRFPFRVFGG